MIPLFKPSYGKEELDALKEPFKTGWIGLGPKTKEFEEKFVKYIGGKYAVGVNSATAALHLALKIMNVENGEVITTPMTFVSTNHAILYNNATPVFADIEEDTLNIDVDEVIKSITNKTKAIIVVHYGGHACNMDSILEISRKKGIKVIEDVAHGCGGEYKGRKLGSLGDVGCFSFHAVKNLATGDGGMIIINDPSLDSRLRKLRWLGISRDTWNRSEVDNKYSWYYTVEELGYKCHMNDITAALGLAQLEKLDRLNEKRKRIVKLYNEAFAGLDWLETPIEKDYAKSANHNYVIKLEKRDELIDYLVKYGISTGVHYFPNHLYSMYKKFKANVPVAEKIWKRLVTLPLFPDLTDSEIQEIIERVREFGKINGL